MRFASPATLRSIRARPCACSLSLVIVAAVALTLSNASAAGRRAALALRSAAVNAFDDQAPARSRDARLLVRGALALHGDESAQALAAGPWRIEGEMRPFTDQTTPDGEASADDRDADETPPPASLPAFTNRSSDLSGDDRVDAHDLLLLLAQWGACPAATIRDGDGAGATGPDDDHDDDDDDFCRADLDVDGHVSAVDIAVLLSSWGCAARDR